MVGSASIKIELAVVYLGLVTLGSLDRRPGLSHKGHVKALKPYVRVSDRVSRLKRASVDKSMSLKISRMCFPAMSLALWSIHAYCNTQYMP